MINVTWRNQMLYGKKSKERKANQGNFFCSQTFQTPTFLVPKNVQTPIPAASIESPHLPLLLLLLCFCITFFFYRHFTSHYERRRPRRKTNDDEQTVRLLFSASCSSFTSPWLTFAFYIIHLSFDTISTTTMTTTMTMTTTTTTTRPLPHITF
jgi:hypothetical protein